MDPDKDILNLIKQIKDTIEINDQAVLGGQAITKCFQEAATKLKTTNEYLLKDIERMKKEQAEMKPLVKMMEEKNKEDLRTIKNGYETLVYMKLYFEQKQADGKKEQDEQNRILKEYDDHIKQIREHLENNTPLYKVLKEKQVQLKKYNIECMQLRKQIEERKYINKQKMEIRRKIFNAQIVNFAKAWIERRDYLEAEKQLEELTLIERDLMKKVAESTELVQKKMRESKKATFMVPIEFPKVDVTMLETSVRKEQIEEEKKSSNPFSDLHNLIESSKVESQKAVSPNTVQSTKPIFKSSHCKVIILEDKVITPSTNKEERSKIIDAKLEKAMKTVNKKISKRFVSQKSILNRSINIEGTSQKTKENKLDTTLSQEQSQKLTQQAENKNSEQIGLDQTRQNTNHKLLEKKFLFPDCKSTEMKKKITESIQSFDKAAFEINFSATKKTNKESVPGVHQELQKPPEPLPSKTNQSQELYTEKIMPKCSHNANRKLADMKFVPQSGFFNKAFTLIGDGGSETKLNPPQKQQPGFPGFSMNFPNSNQHFDRNIDKSTNFSVDLLNAGAGSQFNFGNNTQFNETHDYDGGSISPQIDPNFSPTAEEPTPASQTLFSFGNTGTGGFPLF